MQHVETHLCPKGPEIRSIPYDSFCSCCDTNDAMYSINKLTVVSGQPADLTGTLGSVTESLVVEIVGKAYAGVDNMDGTWKLPGEKIAGLPVGTYDVKVTARNSIGLVRTDSTTNELTVAGSFGNSKPIK